MSKHSARIVRQKRWGMKRAALVTVCGVALAGAGIALAFTPRLEEPPPLGSLMAAVADPLPPTPAEKSQYEITANDNGQTYTYALGRKFSVFLDEEHYPKKQLKCAPAGIIEPAKVMPVVTEPLYVVRYYAVGVGTCTLTNKDFSLKIIVRNE